MADNTTPRVLFITLSNIGDLILTTPALLALHQAHPTARIDIVADRRSSALLETCPFIGELYYREKKDGLTGLFRLLQILRRTRYEAIIDLRTDFIPWLLRGNERAVRWQCKPRGQHAVEQHLAVVAHVIQEISTVPDSSVWISQADVSFAAATLASSSVKRWLAVAPGANWPGKIWPAERYAELLNQSTHLCDGVMLLGSAADRLIGARVMARTNLPCLDLLGTTTLTQAAALLDHARGFVGNDSGLGHLAAARGIPSLTLFGPGRPERYRPWGPHAQIITSPNRALGALEVTPVAEALTALLGATKL